jgi:hypothetical protein
VAKATWTDEHGQRWNDKLHPARERAREPPAQPTAAGLSRGATRRRIEDVREGLRLDREAFDEVWER